MQLIFKLIFCLQFIVTVHSKLSFKLIVACCLCVLRSYEIINNSGCVDIFIKSLSCMFFFVCFQHFRHALSDSSQCSLTKAQSKFFSISDFDMLVTSLSFPSSIEFYQLMKLDAISHKH